MTKLASYLVALLVLAWLPGAAAWAAADTPPSHISFRVASSKGGFVDSASLKGKPHALFFGFTHCAEICPTTLNEMSKALRNI